MPLITTAQLARVASRAVPHVVTAIVDHADDVLPRYGLVTPLRIQHFVAQVLVETGYLRSLQEDLSYSSKRLTEVWPKRFPTLGAAEPYAHRPEALADLVYGGRMGNSRPGDGWANRGSGLLMNTGHDGRVRLADLLHATPDEISAMLVADAWLLECAAADFVALGCVPFADRDDLTGLTKRVNGGLTGLADRRAALKLCQRVWTPSVVIAPGALVPKPAPAAFPPPPAPGAPTVTPNDTARLVGAIERIAADPRTAAIAERALGGATRAVLAAPASGWLAGKKTYIVAGLGVAGTGVSVADAMIQHGGMTPAGWCAAIVALVTSGGFATMRTALKNHFGEVSDLLLQVVQGAVLEAVGGAPVPATPLDAPVAAAEGLLGTVAGDLGAIITR